MLLESGERSRRYCFCAPRVLGSSLGPGAQDRLLSDRTSSPSPTTFSRGLSLGPGGDGPSILVQGGCPGGRVRFEGSKCPLKNIKVISQTHDDGSIGKG